MILAILTGKTTLGRTVMIPQSQYL